MAAMASKSSAPVVTACPRAISQRALALDNPQALSATASARASAAAVRGPTCATTRFWMVAAALFDNCWLMMAAASTSKGAPFFTVRAQGPKRSISLAMTGSVARRWASASAFRSGLMSVLVSRLMAWRLTHPH